jgi:excisionase family DNA binding protein
MKNRFQRKKLLSIRELAEYLGMSPMTIRAKIKKDEFPFKAKRLGRLLKFDIQEVDDYINNLPSA